MNTQLQNTLTANSKIKSAAQASCKTMCVEGVEIGQVFVGSWGYEQTNIDFYQVVGVTAKSVRLHEIKQHKEWKKTESGAEDRTAGGYATPLKNEFVGKAFTRRYDNEYKSVKIADRNYARIWDGKAERFTCYA